MALEPTEDLLAGLAGVLVDAGCDPGYAVSEALGLWPLIRGQTLGYVVSRLRAEASRPENIASMRLLVKLTEEFEAISGASLPAKDSR